MGITANETLSERYYRRVPGSVHEKLDQFRPWIKPGRVLDVGPGDGGVMLGLRAAGLDVHGLDAHPWPESNVYMDPNISVGYADEALDIFSAASFTTIICSSVLHEVYSFGGRNGISPGHRAIETVIPALEALSQLLTPGGRLIIRDGVFPDHSLARHTQLLSLTPHAADIADIYIRHRRNTDGLPYHFDLALDGTELYGSRFWIREFLCTYPWAPESGAGEDEAFTQECSEVFGFGTAREVISYGRAVGLRSAVYSSEFHPGYLKRWEGMSLAPAQMGFPATHGFWVFERP